jgi:CBS-domain-containing membrane protein
MKVSPPPRRWPPEVPDAVWAPLAAAILMVMAGVLGVVADQPWLFPSLGPTAFLQAEVPDHRMARFANTIMGHLIGLGAGYLAVALLQAEDASSVLATGHLTAVRIWASALAIALTILGGILLRISHPPASATTLLVALGSFRPTVHDAAAVCVGVVIVASIGEVLRRIRLGQVIAHWGDMRWRGE